MNKKLLLSSVSLITLIALLFNYQIVLAHESITVGDYVIVYGWVNEPPIAGQLNGVEIFVSNTGSGAEQPVEEIPALVVELSYGGQNKTLAMEPVFDSDGAFDATVIPAIPGLYSVKFSGTLGDTPVNEEVELEEVQAADAVQFPSAASIAYPNPDTAAGTADWFVWLAALLGLTGTVLGVAALRRKS